MNILFFYEHALLSLNQPVNWFSLVETDVILQLLRRVFVVGGLVVLVDTG